MPSTTNVLDEARDLVLKRLAELDEERKRLERALAELGGKATRRSPGRPRGSKSTATATSARPRPARRKRRGGTRADQAVKLITVEPGHHRLGDGQEDEDQAELPLPGARRPARRRAGSARTAASTTRPADDSADSYLEPPRDDAAAVG